MPRGVDVEVGGKRHRLACPIGFIEDVAKIDPRLGELAVRMAQNKWSHDEVTGILESGIRHGECDLTVAGLYDEKGLAECVMLATQLLVEAFGDADEGEPKAAAKKRSSASGR